MAIFHKSKVDGLQKLPTRACLFEDFLHFKGWPYINRKISIDFANKFMIFFGLLDLFYDYPLDFGSIIHPQFFFLYMGYFDSVKIFYSRGKKDTSPHNISPM